METAYLNKAFSKDRFCALFKADYKVNKGNYLKLAIATLGVYIALATLISINAAIEINNLRNTADLTGRILDGAIASRQMSYGSMYLALSMWVFCIGLTAFGSLTFNNFSSKKKRISALMVPASRSEKFSLRVLLYNVGGTLLLIVGLFLGLGICQVVFGGGSAPLNSVLEFVDSEYCGSITIGLILLALLGNSVYALGSSIWPKLSWVKTWVVIMVIQWIFTAILMMLAAANYNWEAFFMLFATLNDDNVWVLIWSGIALLTILNGACWALAWWRFRNTQLIQRFMTK